MPDPIPFPLLCSDDAGAIAGRALRRLGPSERWRIDGEGGGVAHVELAGPGGRVSINERRGPGETGRARSGSAAPRGRVAA